MDKTCSTCRHWLCPEEEEIEPTIDFPTDRMLVGFCDKIQDDVIFRKGVIAIIYNGTMFEENCELHTGEIFGCILWEGKEGKEKTKEEPIDNGS